MQRCLTILAALLLLVSGSVNAATIYKWTGSDGSTHYGQLPPEGVEAVPLETESGPARDGPVEQPEPDDAADEQAAETEPAAEEETADDAGQTSRQQIDEACVAYQENLAVLEDPAVRRIQVGDDEVVVLDEEERSRRIAETRAFIDDWCE
ncbi:DUF4124 domain-containing protein [Methylonatrum kenyense]|uniref:DUF4124 domain-containing protein n=1 Tax=Methylonatrum kenyense TaxID=455253 RepID=UPI0020C07752|nr:DUF4124 domain-containing protein [Methylonatrum kenyense]MCK8516094.1 DUF4124 domain-containing protein [Methylonatrum kenyense]